MERFKDLEDTMSYDYVKKWVAGELPMISILNIGKKNNGRT